MKIATNCIYEHDEHEEILVLGIHRRYDSYDTESDNGVEDGVYVHYTHRWDDYGVLFGTTQTDPIEEFTQVVGEKRRRFGQSP